VVLAVPLAGVLKVVLRVLVARYRASAWYLAKVRRSREEKATPGAFSA